MTFLILEYKQAKMESGYDSGKARGSVCFALNYMRINLLNYSEKDESYTRMNILLLFFGLYALVT